MSDQDVMRYSVRGPRSRKNTEKFIKASIDAYQRYSLVQHAVILKQSYRLIGCCGFFTPMVNNIQEIELSYRLARNYWGQGLGTEAAQACCDYVFSDLHLKRLVSRIEPENTASIRVAEKVGLKFEQNITIQEISVLIYVIEKK
jgi:ribosomal-protein-alanine N-acetyltransferase